MFPWGRQYKFKKQMKKLTNKYENGKRTLENYERKFKETYESPSSQFRTKKLKEIGNEIKTINTTFSKRTRRGRIRKITREELIHK